MIERRMKFSGKVQCQIIDRSGRVIRSYPCQDNLIVNNGMNKLAVARLADCLTMAKAGTGTTPTFDDPGVTVASQTGTTVTLSGGSFLFTDTGTDAGKMISYTVSGKTVRIVSITSTTIAVVDHVESETTADFLVYRTNQASLFLNVDTHAQYATGTGNCGTTINSTSMILKRSYDFATRGSDKTYTEIGIFHSDSTMWSRVILGSSVFVATGRALRVVYTLTINYSPLTPRAIGASPITGWTFTADEQMQLPCMAGIDVSGATVFVAGSGDSTFSMEPSVAGNCFISPSSTAHNAFGSDGPARGTNAFTKAHTLNVYTSLDFFRRKTVSYTLAEANRSDWHSFGVGNSGATQQGLVVITNASQTKDSSHTLSITYKVTWDRVLS